MAKRKEERDFTELLAEERIVVKDVKAKRKVSDEELNLRYVRGEIRIVTESARYSLAGILACLMKKLKASLDTSSILNINDAIAGRFNGNHG